MLRHRSWKAGAPRAPSLAAPSAAKHSPVGKCQQGNPEWHFCLWGDGETPLSELKYSLSQAGFGVSHPPAGPCSSPAVASPVCVGSGEGAVLAFPPLFQDFNFYFRLINFLSSWRWHRQVGKSYGAVLPGALLQDPVCQCPSRLGHPCGKAWLEKWAFLLLQIHSLNTQLTFYRLDSQRLLTSRRSKAKPRLGHPTKT